MRTLLSFFRPSPQLPNQLLLPVILIGLLLPSAAQAQVTNGNFGPVNVGASSASPIALVLTFDANVTVGSTAVLTQGAKNLDFTDAGGGTCTPNQSYSAGNTCTVNVTFKPRAPGPRYGAVELLDSSGNLLANVYVQGTGVGPLATFANSTSGNYLPSQQNIQGSGFQWTSGVAVDASGNLFVTEIGLKEVLAVNGSIPASPTIRSLGSGFVGLSGVAVDGSGNVFVGDRGTNEVKEVVAAGGYTTVKILGGGFNFGGPNGVAVDGSGNVFVADWVDSAVYEIVAAGGYTTVKNLVPGSFVYADVVAVDGDGNVYVTDFGHGAVKEIVAAGGYTTIKTLGSGFNGPAGVAVDGSGNVFVASYGDGTVKEIVAAGGYATVRSLVGGFNIPGLVAVDGSGNVFVADSGNHRIVKLDYADPPSLTFANTSLEAQSSDSPQTVTVSNVGNQALVFTAVSYPADFPEASGGGAAPCKGSISLDPGLACDLNIEFAPEQAGTLSENVTLTDNVLNVTGTEQSIAVNGTATPSIVATHFSVTGPSNVGANVPFTVTVTALDVSGGTASGYTGTVSFTSTDGSAVLPAASKLTAGIGNFPVTLKTQGNQTITVTDAANSLTGTSAAINVGATPPGVYPGQDSVNFGSQAIGSPSGTQTLSLGIGAGTTVGSIAVVTQGAPNLDFTSATGGTCTATTYSSATNCTVNVTFKPRAPGARYGAVELLDSSGNLLVSVYVQGTGVGPLATFANSTSGNYLPSQQIIVSGDFDAVDVSGNVFVTDGPGVVKEILAVNGSIPASPTIRTLSSGFVGVTGLAVDGAGNVFVSDRGANEVKEIVAAGGYSTVKILGGGFYFAGPNGLAVDGSGNVFVADWVNSAVYEILAAGGYTTVENLVPGSFAYADVVAVDAGGNVYVSDFGHGAVKEILAAGGYTTVKTLGSGFNGPAGVAVDGSGNVFVVGYGDGTVKEIVAAGGYATVRSLVGGFSIPGYVAVDGSGNVFVGDAGHHRIVKLDYADPPSLSFANSAVGVKSSDSPQTVTVSNNGNADLTFPVLDAGNNPSLTGAGFTLDAATSCPQLGSGSTAATLAQGASCVYAVDSIPAAVGIDAGTLTLTDNSLNASPGATQVIPMTNGYFPPSAGVLTTPTPGTQLSGSTVDFSWTAGTGVSSYRLIIWDDNWFWFYGYPNLYDSGVITTTSTHVTGLPLNGAPINVMLYSQVSGVWLHTNYNYTAFGTPSQGVLTTPTPGSQLRGSTADFSWTAGTGASSYRLIIGDIGIGSTDLYDSGFIATTSTHVTGLPLNGAPLYVTLYSQVNEVWLHTNYTYTEFGTPSQGVLTTPMPGTQLNGSTLDFSWTPGTGASSYRLIIGDICIGSTDLYDSGFITSTSAHVSLPPNGAPLFVTLYSKVNGVWLHTNYTYTEFGTPSQGVLTTPMPGTQLSGSMMDFSWTAGTGASSYRLIIGDICIGSTDLYDSGFITTTSAQVSLPPNGAPLFVTLYSKVNGVWLHTNYTYTEFGTPSQGVLTTPAPGTQLSGSTLDFSWTPGTGASSYRLIIGDICIGSTDLYDSGFITSTSAHVSLPSNGAPLFVTLYSKVNGVWRHTNYTYTEFGTPSPGVLTSPTPGTQLSGSTVDFSWTAGTGASSYRLIIGDITIGSTDLYDSGFITTTSAHVTGLPLNGAQLFVTLYSKVNGVWLHTNYTYKAQ